MTGKLEPQETGFIPVPAKRTVLMLVAILVTAVTAYRCFVPRAPIPAEDALGYAAVAMNLTEHGVLSERFNPVKAAKTEPVAAAPLVIAELSLMVVADEGVRQTFLCALTKPASENGCEIRLLGLRVVHFIEIMIFLTALYLIARRISDSELVAVLTLVVALLIDEVFEFAVLALTEPLFLMLFGLFLLAWLLALDETQSPWRWALAGLSLGLVALVKAAFLLVLVFAPLLLAPFFLKARGGARSYVTACCLLAVGYLMANSPFYLASFLIHGTPTLAASGYFESTLSHRLGYNLMTLQEWLKGWIYYLPDFGDGLAKALFGKEAVLRLGWGDDSLYAFGRGVLHHQYRAMPDAPSGALRVIRELLANPITYLGVSLLLMWRGIFVGKYLGLAGLISLPFTLFMMDSRARWNLIAIALPGFLMAAAHAGLTVSIPRYNLGLIPVYAMSLGWLAARAIEHRWPTLSRT